MDRTPDSLTHVEIRALRAEAWEARDYELVHWCDTALSFNVTSAMRAMARRHIADAINEAAAAAVDGSTGEAL